MAGLSDLCFDSGKDFESLVSQRFGCSVSSPPDSRSFILIASFGRSTVRLNEDSISLVLKATLGGVAKDFCVTHLSGWMFSFLVSCKDVGFMIYRLKQFICKQYAIFSTFGVMEDQTGEENTRFGAKSRRANRQR